MSGYDEIEVRSRYDGAWSGGFEVARLRPGASGDTRVLRSQGLTFENTPWRASELAGWRCVLETGLTREDAADPKQSFTN